MITYTNSQYAVCITDECYFIIMMIAYTKYNINLFNIQYTLTVKIQGIFFQYVYYLLVITKTLLFKYIENFTTKKGKFSDKKSNIFHISAQNIDCGYSLEPPRWGGSNEYHNLCFVQKYEK